MILEYLVQTGLGSGKRQTSDIHMMQRLQRVCQIHLTVSTEALYCIVFFSDIYVTGDKQGLNFSRITCSF